jgi:hypothetical protein
VNIGELFEARKYLVEEFRKNFLGPIEISYPDIDHELLPTFQKYVTVRNT